MLDWVGALVARQLSKPTSGYEPYAAARPELVAITIRPADVLLVEGARSNINSAIRYLTQSTWSHAALYVGLGANLGERDGEPLVLVEAELGKGVIASPLSKYASYNTRICRPVGLTPEDRAKVIRFATERIGYAYDLKNIIDLMRYFLPQPPVPASWRRRMIALGSGEPTRAICSTLIAQAFESVGYPILPEVDGSTTTAARDPAHPPPFALRAARFRRVAVLRHRQADDRDRIRLQEDGLGNRRRSAGCVTTGPALIRSG